MSLEQALTENTAAVRELIATLKANGGATAAKADTAKKPAATDNAASQTTAETSAAQGKKAETSAPESNATPTLSVDERAALIKDRVAAGKRDAVVALLAEFGAKAAKEITDPAKLAAFDAKLKAI